MALSVNNLFIGSNNEIASKAIRNFYIESERILDSEIAESYGNINNEVFSLLSWLPLEKLYISITTSDSIFYRFKISNSPFEFMWEAFLDYDGEGNKGSTLQIYKNAIKQKATFGDIDYIYNTVNDFAFQNELDTEDSFSYFGIYNSPSEFFYA
jgi:hypothetical protein